MGHRTFEDLKNMSEAQLNERIIPTIADLEVTLVVGSRLKKLIKLRRESAEVSWDPKRKEAVENEDVPSPSLGPRERGRGTEGRKNHPSHRRLGRSTVRNNRQKLIKALQETVKVSWDLKQKGAVEEVPLSSEELKCSGAFCLQQVHTAPFRSQEAVEAVGSRLERQLNKHYILALSALVFGPDATALGRGLRKGAGGPTTPFHGSAHRSAPSRSTAVKCVAPVPKPSVALWRSWGMTVSAVAA